MDYLKILKRALKITWQNKFLWIFGLLAGGNIFNVFSGFNLNLEGFQNQTTRFPNKAVNQISDFFSSLAQHWIVILVIISFFVLLGLVFYVLSIIFQAALIGCVNKIENKEKIDFKRGFILGAKKFWPMFKLFLLTGFCIFLAVVILVVPVILLFAFHLITRGIILAIFAFVILFPLIIILSLIINYAARYIVIDNQRVFQSISLAFNLLKNNILPTIIIVLILLGCSFVVGIVILFILIFLALPFILLGLISYFIGGVLGTIIITVLGIFTVFVISMVISAIYNTFSSTVWTLVFRELKVR